MSNHSSDGMPPEFTEAMIKKMYGSNNAFSKDSERLGATNIFPEGKLTETDEGEIMISIGHHKDKVIIDFGMKPIKWIGFTPLQARQIAELLISHADKGEKA